ncbi:MAG TPA: carbon-nitrogen hydrolase family protein [Chloroflexota bacterium]|nr:carbon-nitrogen hydrolase family protein [Chloroflexota bacterium]
MPRKVFVATTSFGLPTDTSLQRNLDLGDALVDAAGSCHADVVCLPEVYPRTGLPGVRTRELAETVPGPVFDRLAAKARQYGMYVIAGLPENRDGQLINTAVIIDRQGRLVGQYDKVHPTIGEIENGIVPGQKVQVFETDFGRVGLAICYDIGWPAVWDELGALGAEIVFWPSAYDGGFPLQTYAWRNFYYVVSSVWSYHSRVIDITGQPLTSTSRFSRLATLEIDLEKQVFHTDQNASKLLDMTTRLGRRVTMETFTEEHVFTVQSNDQSLSVADIIKEFGLEPFRAYHARAEQVQDQARSTSAMGPHGTAALAARSR